MSESSGRTKLASPVIGSRERQRVMEVLKSGSIAAGTEVQRFEDEFSRYCETEFGIATANGTAALHTALHAAGIGPGDRVLTTPFSFIASTNAIRFVGADPVFVDIDPETYTLDYKSVEAVVNSAEKIDAILLVHLFGSPGPVNKIANLATDHGIVLIEDAAQAHGAACQGQPVGSIGDVGCFSFYPTKNMTTGEGGMIVTDQSDIAERARRFINHGRTSHYVHTEIGYNFRMTDIAAAIGRVQLKGLPGENNIRRQNASFLTDELTDLPVQTPIEPPGYRHVYNQYTIRSPERNQLRDHLDNEGIDTAIYYPTPIHQQPPYQSYPESFPEAEKAAGEVLSLPIHPRVSQADLSKVIRAIRGWSE